MKCMFNIFLGILDEVLGESLDLRADEICQFSSILKKTGLGLNRCDPFDLPLAIITEEGKWEQENDNSQGSLKLRFVILKAVVILLSDIKNVLGVNQKNLKEDNALNLLPKNSTLRSGKN